VKLLLDQDIYEVTARFLIGLEYDVVRVRELGMAQASDEENLKKALELNRVFVTRDRDYGNLVFVKQIKSGVLFENFTIRRSFRSRGTRKSFKFI